MRLQKISKKLVEKENMVFKVDGHFKNSNLEHLREWANSDELNATNNNGFTDEKRFIVESLFNDEMVAAKTWSPSLDGKLGGDIELANGLQVQIKSKGGHIKADQSDQCNLYSIEDMTQTGAIVFTKSEFFKFAEWAEGKVAPSVRPSKGYFGRDEKSYRVNIPSLCSHRKTTRDFYNDLKKSGVEFQVIPYKTVYTGRGL
mgnify:CR=1 FL=1